MIKVVLGLLDIIAQRLFGETIHGASVTEEYARGIAEAIAEELRRRGIYVTPEEIMASPKFKEMVNKWFENWASAFVGKEYLKMLEEKKKVTGVSKTGVVVSQAYDTFGGIIGLVKLVTDTVLDIISL